MRAAFELPSTDLANAIADVFTSNWIQIKAHVEGTTVIFDDIDDISYMAIKDAMNVKELRHIDLSDPAMRGFFQGLAIGFHHGESHALRKVRDAGWKLTITDPINRELGMEGWQE